MLATSIAQWQSVPPDVLKVMGSIPVEGSDFFLSEKDFDVIYLFIYLFKCLFVYLFIYLFIICIPVSHC